MNNEPKKTNPQSSTSDIQSYIHIKLFEYAPVFPYSNRSVIRFASRPALASSPLTVEADQW